MKSVSQPARPRREPKRAEIQPWGSDRCNGPVIAGTTVQNPQNAEIGQQARARKRTD